MTSHARLVHVEPIWGTVVSLHAIGGTADDRCRAVATMTGWLHHVNRTMSTFRPDSELSRYRRGELDPAQYSNLAEVLARAEDACRVTSGAFDPHWRGGRADPTGLVKGWAAQRCAEIGMRFGLAGLQVNAGGEVCTRGTRPDDRPWRIGVENPDHDRMLLDVVEEHDLHVATSGTSRRGCHIAGVHAGQRIRQATLVGPDLAAADAYATAMVATDDPYGLSVRLEPLGYGSLLLDVDGCCHASTGWPGVLNREGAAR